MFLVLGILNQKKINMICFIRFFFFFKQKKSDQSFSISLDVEVDCIDKESVDSVDLVVDCMADSNKLLCEETVPRNSASSALESRWAVESDRERIGDSNKLFFN